VIADASLRRRQRHKRAIRALMAAGIAAGYA
jgi:hypothetical protein